MKVIEALKKNTALEKGERFRKFDAELDSSGFGPSWLKEPEIASLVVEALKDVNNQKLCRVRAYVVMPNHVHVLLEPLAEVRKITRILKGRTAYAANLALGRAGKSFWQDESFDHWIRNSMQWEGIRRYIERNPVSAGLVEKAESWPWSSAAKQSQ